MNNPVSSLGHAVRLRVVAKYLGQLGLMLALLAVVPLMASWFFGDTRFSFRYALVIGLLVLLGGPLARLPAPSRIQTNEALTIIALIFLSVPLVMTYPMMAAGLSFVDALFESVSAVTTTGLTVVGDVEHRPQTFLFARAWMQWYSGLGIVVLSVALLMGHQIAARRLAEPIASETLVTTTRTHARRMLKIYLILTLGGVAVLWPVTGDLSDGALHVLTAVSTAGFSPYNDSIAALPDWLSRYTVIAIAFLGAVPLPLYLYLKGKGWRDFYRDVEFRALVALCAVIGTALTLSLHSDLGGGWWNAARHAFANGISAQSTTGFSTLEIGQLGDASKAVLSIAMFLGGGLGSTAGGIKLLRLLILLRLVYLAVQRSLLPLNAVVETRLQGRSLDADDIQRALMIIMLYALVVVVSWLVFLVYGYEPMDALFEVVSATGTVGLSAGVARADLEPLLKAVLCADMLLGRLEIVAFLVLLYPRNWIGSRVT